MSKFKNAIIHIGTEKTGTSTVQQFLKDNREKLCAEGVFYPKAMSNAPGSQWEFVAAAHPQSWETDAGRAFQIRNANERNRFEENLKTQLASEFSQVRKPETLLISSEHLYGRLHKRIMVERLKRLLDPFVETYRILIYFRRQDRVAVSLLSTRVKSGESKINGVLPKPDQLQFGNYNYFKKYMLWASVFGEEAIQTRLYENSLENKHTIVGDFCEAIGVEVGNKPIPRQMNPSLTRQGVHFLRALNEVMPKSKFGEVDFDRASLVQDVVDIYKGKYQPLNRNQARKFYNQFRGGNEALRKRAFPEIDAPLFNEDFSDYPEKVDNLEPDYVEAVEVAIALWNRARYKNTTVGFLERFMQTLRRKR